MQIVRLWLNYKIGGPICRKINLQGKNSGCLKRVIYLFWLKNLKKYLRKIVGCLKNLSYCDSYVRKYSYMYVLTLECMQSVWLWLNYNVGGPISRKVNFRCKNNVCLKCVIYWFWLKNLKKKFCGKSMGVLHSYHIVIFMSESILTCMY